MTVRSKTKKQIFFAHSGGEQESHGKGSYDLVLFLRAELGDKFNVHYPIIEKPEEPTYAMWNKMLKTEFTKLKDSVILIGHSLGGSMLLKFLSEEQIKLEITALFLIAAPWWGKEGWNVDEFVLKKNFVSTLPDIPLISFYHSKNDEIVPYQHLSFYRNLFPSAFIHEVKGKDHAFQKGLPELVEVIKDIEDEF
ncbi:MAG: alpha/beta hydrolase [Ginsengibacter sp.]